MHLEKEFVVASFSENNPVSHGDISIAKQQLLWQATETAADDLTPAQREQLYAVLLEYADVFVPASQPAVRPGCARYRAPEISHNKGNGGGFTKMLFQRQFTYCTMAIPFILYSLYIPLARCKSHRR